MEYLAGIVLNDEQVHKLSKYVIDAVESNGKTCGSYRYLIYTVIGKVEYSDGMKMGLLELNNSLIGLRKDDVGES